LGETNRHRGVARSLWHGANCELKALGGRLLERNTAPLQLYALPTTRQTGMRAWRRVRDRRSRWELWALSAAAFGKFVAAIRHRVIGTVRLADGAA